MIDAHKLTRMELALITEAIRLLTPWWPDDTITFWISCTAMFAVLGGRAELSPSAEEHCRLTLDHFNGTFQSDPLAKGRGQAAECVG